MDLGENRLGSFSLTTRRIFVGCALILCLLAVASRYFEWGLFGRLERAAVGTSFVALFLVMRYLGPTMHQMRDYRGR